MCVKSVMVSLKATKKLTFKYTAWLVYTNDIKRNIKSTKLGINAY